MKMGLKIFMVGTFVLGTITYFVVPPLTKLYSITIKELKASRYKQELRHQQILDQSDESFEEYIARKNSKQTTANEKTQEKRKPLYIRDSKNPNILHKIKQE